MIVDEIGKNHSGDGMDPNITGSYRVPLDSKRHTLTIGGWWRYRDGQRFSAAQQRNVVVGPGPDGIQDVPLGTLQADIPEGIDDQAFNVTEFASPRGSYTESDIWRIDLSLLWNFSFSKKVSFETRFELFNVTDEQKANNVNVGYVIDPQTGGDGLTNYRFGYPQVYDDFQNARNFQVTFGILW